MTPVRLPILRLPILRLPITLAVLLPVGLLLPGALSAAVLLQADGPIHISELMALKNQWPDLAAENRIIRLEARYSARTGPMLRLRNCDLGFRADDAVRIPRIRDDKNLEIVGRIVDTGKRLEFRVQRLAVGSSDMEQLASLRRRLPDNDAQPWYEVAEKFAARARFYDDPELLQAAEDTTAAGFRIERRLVASGDADALRKLADQVPKRGLPDALRAELIHESLRWRWTAMQARPQADRAALIKLLETELEGCRTPIRLRDEKLEGRYRADPIASYAAAPESDRLRMHRLFYREVLLPGILADARPDGSNGDEIASRLRKAIPEEAELADTYARKHLDWRVSGADTGSRAEMLLLTDELIRNGQKGRADEVRRRWVKATADRLASRGPAGLVQAASEYEALLGDRTKAIELLQAAWEQSSDKTEIEERLERFGLYRRNDQWMTQQQVDALPENQMQQAMRAGRVVRGMSPQQVRSTLGRPNRVTRFATASHMQMVWLFGEPTTNRISVLFDRKLDQAGHGSKVIAVSTLPPR